MFIDKPLASTLSDARAIARVAGAENLRAAWRRRIGLWLPEDSLIFNRMVTDAWNDVVSRNPFLKTMID